MSQEEQTGTRKSGRKRKTVLPEAPAERSDSPPEDVSDGEWATKKTSKEKAVIDATKRGGRKRGPASKGDKADKADKADKVASGAGRGGRKRVARATASEKQDEAENEAPEEEEKERPRTEDEEEKCELYQNIAIKVKSAVGTVADNWSKKYASNRADALCEMANFLIQTCGSRVTLTLEDAEEDREELVKRATANTSADYPLISTHRKHNQFKSRFAEFWKKLICNSKIEVLYDDVMVSYILSWLHALSGCELRSFRHTVTQAYIDITNALIEASRAEKDRQEGAHKLLKAELGKSKKSPTAIARLNGDIKECGEHLAVLAKHLQEAFTNVFVHRYRDIDAMIRTLCIEGLGTWLVQCPDVFLKDNYLKYIGWCLYDKDAQCRKAALEGVLHLYQLGDQEVTTLLEQFHSRFRKRFFEMMEDIDSKVAAVAINLLTLFLKSQLLMENEGDALFGYLWDDAKDVRRAAVGFVFEDTFSENAEDPSQVGSKEKEKEDDHAKHEGDIQQLLNIYDTCCPWGAQTNILEEEAVDMLVDGFWTHLSALKDWQVIGQQVVLSEKERRTARDVPTDDKRQSALVHLLLSCAKRATGQEETHTLPATTTTKPKRSKKDKEETESLSESLSIYLIKNLNEIITVFQVDKVKIAALVQLPRYIQLEKYTEMREKKSFDGLLKLLRSIFCKHTEDRVLQEIATTFRYLATTDSSLKEDAMRAVRDLAKYLVERFAALEAKLPPRVKDSDPEMIADVLVILHRITALYQAMNLKECKYTRLFEGLFEKHLSQEDGNQDLVAAFLKMSWLDMMWMISGDKTPEADVVAEVRAQHGKLMTILRVMESEAATQRLKDAAFTIAGDSFVWFTSRLHGTDLTDFALAPTKEIKDLYLKQFQVLVAGTWHPDHAAAAELGDEEEAKEEDQARKGARRARDEIDEKRVVALLSAIKAVCSDPKQHVDLAGHIIATMLQHGKEVDRIIQGMMGQLRALSTADLLAPQLFALQFAFEDSGTDMLSDLSKKLVLSHPQFKKTADKERAFAPFLKDGISYGLADSKNYAFLQPALLPFLSRAPLAEVLEVRKFWEKEHEAARAARKDDDDAEAWEMLAGFDEVINERIAKKGGVPRKPIGKTKSGESAATEKEGEEGEGEAEEESSAGRSKKKSAARISKASAASSASKVSKLSGRKGGATRGGRRGGRGGASKRSGATDRTESASPAEGSTFEEESASGTERESVKKFGRRGRAMEAASNSEAENEGSSVADQEPEINVELGAEEDNKPKKTRGSKSK